MTREDLTEALGTIARSGTKAFLDKLAADGSDKAGNLIGQFGIGFYSSFMVADEVTVDTRRAGSADSWRWKSDGKGTYTIEPIPFDLAPSHGTRVTLKLNASPGNTPSATRSSASSRSIRARSPCRSRSSTSRARSLQRVTDGAAIWAKSKSDVTPEEYTEFYRSLAGQYDEPALTVHWRAEGRHEYTVLAFVPGSRPFDLFDPARKGKAKLYVRRVLISSDADLLPGWLRFVRLVVDSADLPLNVSREMIQESAVFAAIKKGVVNRLVQEMTKLAENEPEKYAKLWENFGGVLKEGLYEDPERRDALFKLARFVSTQHADGGRTLEAYVKDLRENQTAIYYLTGDDAKRLAASPQLEGFRARGVEVLLLADPVDAFWVSTAAGFDGKPFKSISQGAADIKSIALGRGRDPSCGSQRGSRDADRPYQADAGGRDRGRARVRPAHRQRRLSGGARIRAGPAVGEDARRAWARDGSRQAGFGDQRDPSAHRFAGQAVSGGARPRSRGRRGVAAARRGAACRRRAAQGRAGFCGAAAARDGAGAGLSLPPVRVLGGGGQLNDLARKRGGGLLAGGRLGFFGGLGRGGDGEIGADGLFAPMPMLGVAAEGTALGLPQRIGAVGGRVRRIRGMLTGSFICSSPRCTRAGAGSAGFESPSGRVGLRPPVSTISELTKRLGRRSGLRAACPPALSRPIGGGGGTRR